VFELIAPAEASIVIEVLEFIAVMLYHVVIYLASVDPKPILAPTAILSDTQVVLVPVTLLPEVAIVPLV
jgi:hypothetical protein